MGQILVLNLLASNFPFDDLVVAACNHPLQFKKTKKKRISHIYKDSIQAYCITKSKILYKLNLLETYLCAHHMH